MRPLKGKGHCFGIVLVLAGLIAATGNQRAAAQFIDNARPEYGSSRMTPTFPGVADYGASLGYNSVYPSVTPPPVIFPPGLPDPKPFALDPALASPQGPAALRCLAGAYVCLIEESAAKGTECSCPTDTGRISGRTETDQAARQ